jgi:hypothetical protein
MWELELVFIVDFWLHCWMHDDGYYMFTLYFWTIKLWWNSGRFIEIEQCSRNDPHNNFLLFLGFFFIPISKFPFVAANLMVWVAEFLADGKKVTTWSTNILTAVKIARKMDQLGPRLGQKKVWKVYDSHRIRVILTMNITTNIVAPFGIKFDAKINIWDLILIPMIIWEILNRMRIFSKLSAVCQWQDRFGLHLKWQLWQQFKKKSSTELKATPW